MLLTNLNNIGTLTQHQVPNREKVSRLSER